MKLTLTLQNDWRYLLDKGAEFTVAGLNFDWLRGYYYCASVRLLGFGFCAGVWLWKEPITDEYAADDVPHPFGDPDALTGNITSPIGAQSLQPYDEVGGESGWSQAIKEAHEDSPQAMNWVRPEDGS